MADGQEPRTVLPDGRVIPRFSGVATFCRYPLLEAAKPPVDWALYGIPFDGGVTYHPGARFGPRAIRDASQYIKPLHLDLGIHLGEVFSLADAGDAPVRPFSCPETLEVAFEYAKSLGDPGHTKLLAVGGDHSIAYANLRATWHRRGRPAGGLALLHFDAHFDTADVVWGSKWSHASPLLRAIEDGLIDPARMLSIGVRGPLNSLEDLQVPRKAGAELVTYEQWRSGDGRQRFEAFLSRIAGDEVYLSFDIDCIDPAFAPGTGTPSCGGFTSAEAMGLLRQCAGAGLNVVGADLVEVLPARDPGAITALLAGHIIFEILCVAAGGKLAGLKA
ncbi:MAG: agmatinase [Planctomycetes bacterium]|nr:agmatinase [Planctomycetota bacterium]